MPLDPNRQAQLDVLCHCYRVLLDGHLDALEIAAAPHRSWDCYRIVKKCFNPATDYFAKQTFSTPNLSVLCEDFLERTKGLIKAQLPRQASAVLQAFDEYAEAVQATPISDRVDLREWQVLGEQLSIDCYQPDLLAPGYEPAQEAHPLRITFSAEQRFHSDPDKDGGKSLITFYFSPRHFVFQSYVNLPLFCFHEYFSHVHTAPMLGEDDPETVKPFEDGWLLWAARDFYAESLSANLPPNMDHHGHRLHYACQFFDEMNSDAHPQIWVRDGYEKASKFARMVGLDLFWRVTLLVATSAHNHFPGMSISVHWDFVKLADQWRQRLTIRSMHQKEKLLDRLDELLKRPNPLKELFEFLVTP